MGGKTEKATKDWKFGKVVMERRVNGGIGLGFEEDRYSNGVARSNGIVSSSTTTPPTSKYLAGNSFPSPATAVGTGGLSCIVHPVSKFDTLAGVAIKYGVEVADIKRLNGLVTDLQMFARKTLQIPLPGRHPPSPVLSNGSESQGSSSPEKTPSRPRKSDFSDEFQSLKLTSRRQREVSPAMSSLQGYYGLKTNHEKPLPKDLEMAVFAKPSIPIDPPLGLRRNSRSLANGFLTENGHLDGHASAEDDRDNDPNGWIDKLLPRRRQKSEAGFSPPPPEMLVTDENCSGGSFSAVKSKNLALRPKSASRTVIAVDSEAGWSNPTNVGSTDLVSTDGFSGVKKSSSTSSLQESDSSTLLSIWPNSKWSLKPDLTAGITKPIFDGIPNPITGRRNKAALD